jgi:hypothetical protein
MQPLQKSTRLILALSKHFKHKSSKYFNHHMCVVVDGVRDSVGLALFKNQFYGSHKHQPILKASALSHQSIFSGIICLPRLAA